MQRDACGGDEPVGAIPGTTSHPHKVVEGPCPVEGIWATHPVFETSNRGESRTMRRLRWFWVIYTGNLYACNRRYFGWISMRTAWQAATALVNAR